MKLPIVREDYLVDCFKRQKKLPFDIYKVEALGEWEDYLVDCFKRQKKLPFDIYKVEALGESSSMVTVKVKGRSAVHESSGLQDTGRILEDGKSIYNTTLSMSDLSTGVNSSYILQIIQDDKSSNCYVFRKWGGVGMVKLEQANWKIWRNQMQSYSHAARLCYITISVVLKLDLLDDKEKQEALKAVSSLTGTFIRIGLNGNGDLSSFMFL